MQAFTRPLLTFCAALIVALSAAAPAQAQSQATYKFDLPEQPMADALRAIARQTGANVLFESKDLKGVRAPALQAQLTTQEAIQRILEGTKLTAQRTTPTTVVIQPAVQQTSSGGAPVILVGGDQ